MSSTNMSCCATGLAGRQGRSARQGQTGWLTLVVAVLLTWHERARQRRQLRGLSDRMLSDIGITRAEAEAEAEKPFWRL